ncbi:hypothetical protein NIES2119_26475 [[Phormidium ambiguum] IAM M-71]|uniref:DUF4186 domain-containing protein n=2 Tax=[Phormidium ambiguum] IAM M-71 TaxID=454136 RepID=A0A1U7I7P4_9CYAN|nr:hypothetical protein NIES2119_26475 [Phormidium ambiguum IAM M-71]
MSTDWNAEEELKPLKLKCTSTDCKNDLHCFLQKQTRKMKPVNQFGNCRQCGAELVDWERVHKRDINDAKHTFEALKHEKFRHDYWHREIDQNALDHALRKGQIELRKAATHRIRKYVGEVHEMPDGKKRPYRDGQQTPYSGNSIFYAQHATACCCRKCIEYWHNIPQGRDLTNDEIAYLTDLVMLYIEEKLPNLTDQAQKVPRKSRQSPKSSSTEDKGGKSFDGN